jgi:hypothetical protein
MDAPAWLSALAAVSLAVALICCVIVILDIVAGHRQHMWIMERM